MQQLSGQDAMFVYFDTTRTPFHLGGFSTYDPSTAPGGSVSFDDVVAHVESRLPLLPSLRQRLVRVPLDLDHPYWVDDPDFDLEYHLRNIGLPRPGDWRQLRVQVARLLARPLDPSRPLWEIYVIEGLEEVPGLPKGSFSIVTKLHHAAVDGVAGTELTTVLHTSTPERVAAHDAAPWSPETQPSSMALLRETARNFMVRPGHLVSAVGRTLPALRRLALSSRSGEVQRQRLRPPKTRFNAPIDGRRNVDGCDFDLDEMKRVKAVVPGATLNDVVLAIVGGAQRIYLEAKGELPDTPLVGLVPMSVRTEEQRGAGGNQVSTMRVSLATDVADPLERLAAIRQSTANAKARGQLVGARTLVEYSEFIPGGLIGVGARALLSAGLGGRAQQASPMMNVAVTNIPGPQTPIYLAGARMVASYGMPPLFDGSGLIQLAFSYCGRLFLSVFSTPKVLPDIEVYTDALRTSFSELHKAVS